MHGRGEGGGQGGGLSWARLAQSESFGRGAPKFLLFYLIFGAQKLENMWEIIVYFVPGCDMGKRHQLQN